MTTKHSFRNGGVVALVAAIAALSMPVSVVTARGPATAPSARPVPAAARPESGSARAAAPAGRSAVLPDLDLCARAGSTTMPNSIAIQVWGYEPGTCSAGSTITKPGGPVITVTAGDEVHIVLHNGLGLAAENTSLLFQGQAIPPDTTGAAMGGTATYTFVAANPGTYLYEAGLTANGQHQVAMGLYGALVVRPLGAPAQAYNAASTAFDDEGVLVLGEIDTALNNSANKAAFDMRNFKPKYFTINGKAYSASGSINTAAGNKVLLRYVNAGITYHSMSLLGGSQQIIGYDGNPLTYPHRVAAETFGPGQTVDALVRIPATTANGTKFAIYDANLLLNNSTAAGFGGMMAFIDVSPVVTGDTTGPLVTAVSASPNPSSGTGTVTLAATAADPSDVAAAEYRVDGGTATAFTGIVAAPTVALSAPIDATPLSQASHSIQVRAQDGVGNWSGWSGTTLVVDRTAPTISGVALSPNPSLLLPVALHAAAADTGLVAAAEYRLDGGAGVPFTVATAAGLVSLDATVTAPADPGPGLVANHLVEIRARDVAGNWSAWLSPCGTVATPAPCLLVSDHQAPVTSGVSANPAMTNGTVGVNPTTPAVRIGATATDADSNLVGAEGFIDTVGAPGTGFLFVPIDGAWSSHTEAVTADIPLTTVLALSSANHIIQVRAKDAAGNWGLTATTTLVVDKVVPVVNNPLTVTPNPASATVALSAAGTDNLSGVSRVEWFTGTDPGRGLANAMTVTGTTSWTAATSIDVSAWASGSYTLSVRARDAALNWSLSRTVQVTVSRGQLYFSTLGNTNPPLLAGTADDADVYNWNGSFGRTTDVTTIANAVPAGANVDGLEFDDATHFYLSFSGDTTLPGLGLVQDEDIVFYNAGTWSVYFDGTSHGLGANANQDIDEFAIVGANIYYSTVGNTNPTGVAGTADDADIYLWSGTTTTRFFDATVNGLAAAANVDGISFVDATHFYLSFAADAAVPGLGTVQDEDVVKFSAGSWSLWFDGTSLGLTNANHDLDAIDVP